MNRAQRTVLLIFSFAVAATLFLGIPKQGRHEVTASKAQVEWDWRADSLDALLAPSAIGRILGVTETGTELYPDTMRRRLKWQGMDDRRAGYLGQRPGPVTRFIHEPDAFEVLLRYVVPLLLVGLGLFVFFGKPKGSRAA